MSLRYGRTFYRTSIAWTPGYCGMLMIECVIGHSFTNGATLSCLWPLLLDSHGISPLWPPKRASYAAIKFSDYVQFLFHNGSTKTHECFSVYIFPWNTLISDYCFTLTFYMLNFSEETRTCIYISCSPHWHDMGTWNHSWCKTRPYLFYHDIYFVKPK